MHHFPELGCAAVLNRRLFRRTPAAPRQTDAEMALRAQAADPSPRSRGGTSRVESRVVRGRDPEVRGVEGKCGTDADPAAAAVVGREEAG